MRATARIMYGPYGPQKGVLMILPVMVCIKEIVEKGREFPWPRPESCGACGGNRIWGHGFVGAYFDGVANACGVSVSFGSSLSDRVWEKAHAQGGA